MRVLIVDDSKAMRLIVKRTLRKAGFAGLEIEEASNGREALDALGQRPVDLVLCDWNMPEMTGIELLEQLAESGAQTPFGFVTSEGTPAMRERAQAAGARFLIAKPFTVDAFQAALGPVLG
jgi:two-component system chemotaxis response regulator CheY